MTVLESMRLSAGTLERLASYSLPVNGRPDDLRRSSARRQHPLLGPVRTSPARYLMLRTAESRSRFVD